MVVNKRHSQSSKEKTLSFLKEYLYMKIKFAPFKWGFSYIPFLSEHASITISSTSLLPVLKDLRNSSTESLNATQVHKRQLHQVLEYSGS